MRKTLLLTFLSFCMGMPSFASWQLPVTNYFPKDYAAGTQNWQIKQQQNGWIYSANNYGLLEFDGIRWALHGIWNATVVRSVEIAPDGSIYVGGSNEYGRFVSNGVGGLDYEQLSINIPDSYKNFGEVWNLHLLHGDLYVQTRNYIFKHSSGGEWSVIEPKSRIFCTAKIRDGLFVATAEGIYLMAGRQLNALRGSEQLRGYEIQSLQPYGENGVLIGTDFNGLFLFNGDAIVPFATEADAFIRANQLYTMAVGEKYIAYGTVLNGLAITDLNGKNCQYVNTLNGLQNSTVLSLLFDDENNLWLGLDQGIDRLVIDAPIAQLYGQLYSYGSGYASYVRKDRIYVGTNQGLYSGNYPFNPKEHRTTLQLIEGSLGQVWMVESWDNLLLCSHNRGLFIVSDHKLEPVLTGEGVWQVRPLPQQKNLAIAGSYNGFYLLQKTDNTIRVLHKIKGFEETARNFEIDEKGNIWTVSSRGVEQLTLDSDFASCAAKLIHTYTKQNDYFSILKLEGKVYITHALFCRVVNAQGNTEEANEFFQLLDGVGHYPFIRKDAENNLWYLIGDALKVRTYNMRTRTYSSQPIQIINQPRFFVGGFAHLNLLDARQAIVGCVSGFGLVSLDNALTANPTPARTAQLRRMTLTKLKDSVIYGESYPIQPKQVAIPYKNNSVRFEFGGLFCLDGTEEYRVRLLPIESDFGGWSKSYTKEYTSLREGKYTLQLQTRSSNTAAGEITSVPFTVLPPWYRTWWIYLLYACAVASLLFSTYRYIVRKIESSKRKVARQKDEEMKIRERQFSEEAHMREKEILKLQNERTEFELRNKSKELANILLNHLNKNELVSDIKRDIKKIANDLQEKELESANRRITLLQGKLTRNIEQEIEWKKFEENFDLVNDKFLKKLLVKYPWLNKNEQKLCVYIHMGLYTKEISPLMNLSVRGVEMLRYRMRKKMGLDRSDDLEHFFQTIQANESISDM